MAMDKESAIKWLDSLTQAIGQMRHQDLWHYEQALSEISTMIDKDLVKVVRCRFCKHKIEVPGDPNAYQCVFDRRENVYKPPYHYCSLGEEEDNDDILQQRQG